MQLDYIKQGDCLELMNEIPDSSIDMILCDLPYGTTACKWDSIIPFDDLWAAYKRIIKDNGAIVLFGSEPFSTLLRSSNLSMFRYDWIWKKNKATQYLNANRRPLGNYEIISVFSCRRSQYNPQMGEGKAYNNNHKPGDSGECYGNVKYSKRENVTTRYPKTIIDFPVVMKPVHPTQKPVVLLEYLIKTYTNEGDTVLDNCMGSGSTCVACVNTNRHYIGYELNEQYFKIAEDRISKALIENNKL